MDLLNIASFVIALISGFMAWYYPTKKKRFLKKIEQNQLNIKTIEQYTSNDGFKLILRDSFQLISYSLSVCMLSSGITLFLYIIYPKAWVIRTLISLTGAVFLAAGSILFQLFLVLSNTIKPQNAISKYVKKLNQIESELEKI